MQLVSTLAHALIARADVELHNPNIYDVLFHDVFDDESFSMSWLVDWKGRDAVSLDEMVVIRREPFLRLFGSASGNSDHPLPRHQQLQQQHPELFTTLRGVADLTSAAFISHRWAQPGQPDPLGEQLRAVVAVLEARPALQFVWYDFWCMPQRRSEQEDDRSAAERAVFQRGLANLKWLNVEASLVPLWGADYLDRAWCFAEVLWGYDHMVVVAGVNEPSPALKAELDKQYRLLLAKAMYVRVCVV